MLVHPSTFSVHTDPYVTTAAVAGRLFGADLPTHKNLKAPATSSASAFG